MNGIVDCGLGGWIEWTNVDKGCWAGMLGCWDAGIMDSTEMKLEVLRMMVCVHCTVYCGWELTWKYKSEWELVVCL